MAEDWADISPKKIYIRPISSIAKLQRDTTSHAKRWMIVSVGKNIDNQDTHTAAGNVKLFNHFGKQPINPLIINHRVTI